MPDVFNLPRPLDRLRAPLSWLTLNIAAILTAAALWLNLDFIVIDTRMALFGITSVIVLTLVLLSVGISLRRPATPISITGRSIWNFPHVKFAYVLSAFTISTSFVVWVWLKWARMENRARRAESMVVARDAKIGQMRRQSKVRMPYLVVKSINPRA